MGIDIDAQARRNGNEFLKQHGSKAVLAQRDKKDREPNMRSRTFNLSYSSGVPE